jgi:hypothetical protein
LYRSVLNKTDKRKFLQIHHAWQQITENNMRGVWKRILPHCVNSSYFEETVIEEIINTGRKLGFDELENDDVRELLSSHSEELTDDDLLLLDYQRAFEEAENAEKRNNVQVREVQSQGI